MKAIIMEILKGNIKLRPLRSYDKKKKTSK